MSKPTEAILMPSNANHSNRSTRALKIAALAACALALVGCKSNREITGSVPDDYRLRHPITLQQSARTIDIPSGIHSERLTPASRSAVASFARDFTNDRAAVIQVMVPSGADNEMNAGYMAKEIRTELMRAGVHGSQIDLLTYSAANAQSAPIRLAYPRMEAKTLTCGTHPADFSEAAQNRSHFDFGCSTQQNLASFVANPEDLLHPRGWSPRDSTRRSITNGKYRNGEPTWSEDIGSKIGTSSEVMK